MKKILFYKKSTEYPHVQTEMRYLRIIGADN